MGAPPSLRPAGATNKAPRPEGSLVGAPLSDTGASIRSRCQLTALRADALGRDPPPVRDGERLQGGDSRRGLFQPGDGDVAALIVVGVASSADRVERTAVAEQPSQVVASG
jgi:hypothetical protein